MELDETDLKLVDFLRKDSSISYTELAKQLDISDVAIKKRVDKLLANNVIKNFTINVNYRELGKPIHAFLFVKCVPREADKLNESFKAPDILRVMPTIGEYDYIVEVATKSVEDLRAVAEDKIGGVRGVLQVRTVIVV